MDDTPNILLVTLDSCRWDTFRAAQTPNLDSLCLTRKAYAQATFTYAAHMAMYQGHLPSTREKINFYNRFVMPLFRIANTQAEVTSYITFPKNTRTIIHGFRSLGFYALGLGATGWFRHPDLNSPFDEFELTGIHADRQVEIVKSKLGILRSRAFFALVNMGETHDPYEFGGSIYYDGVSRARAASSRIAHMEFDEVNWLKQVKACEFLDAKIGEIVSHLRALERGTIVVICGDHGECFGEDGMHGHGFYHPKVMEVPLGVFEINCQFLKGVLPQVSV